MCIAANIDYSEDIEECAYFYCIFTNSSNGGKKSCKKLTNSNSLLVGKHKITGACQTYN